MTASETLIKFVGKIMISNSNASAQPTVDKYHICNNLLAREGFHCVSVFIIVQYLNLVLFAANEQRKRAAKASE